MPKRSGAISDSAPGLIIAAPASGSGKTTLALGLAHCLGRDGTSVSTFKAGPDYIDPAFHQAATRRACLNIDPWAMHPATVQRIARRVFTDADFVVGEGVMGLFDGAPDGTGSTADIAATLGLPVVLVIDASGMGASAGALVRGFAGHREDVPVAGVIFNRVGGARHEAILRAAAEPLRLPVLGAVPRDSGIDLPSRHLGLVQASEHGGLADIIGRAAGLVEEHVNLAGLKAIARVPGGLVSPAAPAAPQVPAPPPLGQRIAVARDIAFAFSYPALLDDWHVAGASLAPFSPLAGEAPAADADAIYLPGGYPELHAPAIAANGAFMEGLHRAAAAGVTIYGECGGYMVLGDGLTDADGTRHAMAGLLPLETSFAARKLALGYREATLAADSPLGPVGTCFRGHEFHYATTTSAGAAEPLFESRDATGQMLGATGMRAGPVMGSFVHIVDRAGA